MDIDDSVVEPKHPSLKRARGPGISPAKCCTYICSAVGVAVVLLIIGSVITVVVNTFLTLTHIHKDAFTANITDVAAADIARPLIDIDTRFDIALTIWARVPNNKSSHPEWYAEGWDAPGVDRNRTWPVYEGDLSVEQPLEMSLAEVILEHEEVVLFSDVVIRDYSLLRKRENLEVKFELPLERFYDKDLYHQDVRATVVLLPQSPSRLDSVANVSTFMPSHLRTFPWLSDALNSSQLVGAHDSVYQRALGSLAVTWPLIELKEEKRNVTNAKNETKPPGDEPKETTSLEANTSAPAGNSDEVDRTPYLRTRLHAYIVNETRSTLRETLNEKFKDLSKKACKGIPSADAAPSTVWSCTSRKYMSYGHWTAQYLLEGGLEGVAYPPFVDDMPHTPKHVVRLPVNRTGSPSDDKAVFNVTFGFTFSTVHHRRQFAKEFYSPAMLRSDDKPSDSPERQLASTHDTMQVLLGALTGHADEEFRPWTRVILGAVNGLLVGSVLLLEATYWWTRRTTTGISFPATWGMLLNSAVINVVDAKWWEVNSMVQNAIVLTLVVIGTVLFDLPKLLLVFPISIGNYGKGWTVFKRRRTHRERASRRREPPWWQVILLHVAISCFFTALGKLSKFQSLWLIRPVYNSSRKEDRLASSFPFRALPSTALVLQLALNRTSGTFAGGFALASWLYSAKVLIELAYFSTRVVGHYDVHEGLSLGGLIGHALTFVRLYQAIKYPRVEQNVPDEDEE
ncbi:hypothetical protein Q8F55_007831 [Vanrija albida]|uniref:Uncharacterized protein n=1 Tax=Vanrija albida TaxID=181172 RepID=A0ABR3PVJ2_9TREE